MVKLTRSLRDVILAIDDPWLITCPRASEAIMVGWRPASLPPFLIGLPQGLPPLLIKKRGPLTTSAAPWSKPHDGGGVKTPPTLRASTLTTLSSLRGGYTVVTTLVWPGRRTVRAWVGGNNVSAIRMPFLIRHQIRWEEGCRWLSAGCGIGSTDRTARRSGTGGCERQ